MQINSEAVPQRAVSIRTGFARYSRQLISDPVVRNSSYLV